MLEGCDYIAAVPPQATKTRILYKWGLLRRMNPAVKLVEALHKRAPTLKHLRNQHHLSKMLFDWFTKRILKDAAKEDEVVKAELKGQPKHNLRSVRCHFANIFKAQDEEAAAEGKKHPANPLQHKVKATTYRCYVPPPKGTTAELLDADILYDAA